MTDILKAPITALAPWFGGKRNLTPAIAAEFGEHSDYWEPFCGSMAVLFGKSESRNETVNDLHGDLINLATVVQDEASGPRLYRRLRRTLFCEDWHKRCQEALKAGGKDELDRAYLYFVKSWMGMSGIAGTERAESKLCIRYTSTGGNPSVRYRNAVASIPAWMRRLRGVRILNRDGFEIIAKIPDTAGVLIYCDPPYLSKGAQYLHDFDDQQFLEFADGRVTPIHWAYELEPGVPRPKQIGAHEYLAKLLGRFKKARVVVSYYEHPDLEILYPGWTRVSLLTRKALVCQSARDMDGVDAPAPEILLINGNSLARGQHSLFNDEA